MLVKTYKLQLNIAYNSIKVDKIQKELDEKLGYAKSGITLNRACVLNGVDYVVNVWALGSSEYENESLIEKIELFFDEKNIQYKKQDNYIIWNDGKVYKEFNG